MESNQNRWLQEIEARHADIRAILTDESREPEEAFRVINESLVNSLRAARVGIWRLGADQDSLVCSDLFDKEKHSHRSDLVLKSPTITEFLAGLKSQRSTVITSVQSILDENFEPHHSKGISLPTAAILAATDEGPLRSGFLSVARTDNNVNWTIEELGIIRAVVNFLPILFHAQENRRSLAKLKQSLSLLTGTLESTDEGIVATDLERNITLANHRFMELIGRTNENPSSIYGTTIREHLHHKTSQPDEITANVNYLYANPEAQAIHRIEYKSGQVFERYSRPQRIEGKIVGRIFNYRDITELVRTEKAKERLEAHLRQSQKLEAIGTLAGGIAHDFNNILSGITCNLELLRTDIPPGHPAQTSLHDITLATHRATDLVKRILTFSRQSEQTRKSIQPGEVITEALNLIKAGLPRSIALEINLANPLPLIEADATSLHQILINLCTNARQAIGTEPGTIAISAKAASFVGTETGSDYLLAGNYLHLEVKDSGCGMDQHTLDHLFEPFFTTKEPGTGTGLGLSVVHGIIRAHGGTIKVSSAPRKGTRFDLYFPEHSGPVSAPVKVEKTASTGNSGRILFVDDEPILTRVGSEILARSGYTVDSFHDPISALTTFETAPHSYHAAIIDYGMPILRGTEMAKRLRSLNPQLPILLVTGDPNQLNENQMAATKINEVLIKPLSGQTLVESLSRVLSPRAQP